MRALPNSVLPTKIYGVWEKDREIGRVNADDVHQAFRDARAKYGKRAGAVIFSGKTSKEPMFDQVAKK